MNFPVAALPAGTDIPFTQAAKSTIAIDSGTNTLFTLTPGHVYILSLDIAATAGVVVGNIVTIEWVDAANVVLSNDGGAQLLAAEETIIQASNKPSTHTIVDLTTAQAAGAIQVKARVTAAVGGGLSAVVLEGSALIRQLF